MKLLKRTLAIIFSIVLVVTSFSVYFTVSAVEYPCAGSIDGTGVRMRKGAGINHDIVLTTTNGQKLTVTGEAKDKDGDLWYAVTLDSGQKGYVYSDYVHIHVSYSPDADFEKYLTSQGFPESYKEKLRQLHAEYPNWIFVADHLEISWSDAYKRQTEVGVSLIQSPNAWKSMKPGAYSWENNSYISYDSGGWYAAHDDVVAYFLDPRNFLNSQSIFQFVGMSFDENVHTKEALSNVLKGTFMEGDFPEEHEEYKTWADVLFAASKTYGMSPYALAAMILLEQGTAGNGALISGKVSGYEGYYNFLNVGAYQNDSGSAVLNGMKYASSGKNFGRPWNSRLKSIFGGAEYYVYEYIEYGQDTLYYKKFNVISKPFGTHQYMTNIQGAEHEGAKARDAYKNMMDASLVFNIPVYSGMPETPMNYPTKTGDNNFYLSSLTVEGFSLSPSFDLYKNDYELIVDGSVSKIKVSATPKNSSAVVTGTGEHSLKVGKNVINVTVTSTSKRVNTYQIIVSRNEDTSQSNTSFSKSVYSFSDTLVSGVPAGTTTAIFATNLDVKNGSIKILNADGTQNNNTVATGNTVQILKADGSVFESYVIAVKGDVSGDGKISLLDLSKVQGHLLKIQTLSDAYAVAADVSGDSKISLLDLSKIQGHLLKLQSIS